MPRGRAVSRRLRPRLVAGDVCDDDADVVLDLEPQPPTVV
jgi:hypothetical protein